MYLSRRDLHIRRNTTSQSLSNYPRDGLCCGCGCESVDVPSLVSFYDSNYISVKYLEPSTASYMYTSDYRYMYRYNTEYVITRFNKYILPLFYQTFSNQQPNIYDMNE